MPDLEVRRLGRTEMRPKALGLGGVRGRLLEFDKRLARGWQEASDLHLTRPAPSAGRGG